MQAQAGFSAGKGGNLRGRKPNQLILNIIFMDQPDGG
jgi:hypothetical protein